jgi:hypothetical protein
MRLDFDFDGRDIAVLLFADQRPLVSRDFAMGRVFFARYFLIVAAERKAEKVAAQGAKNWRWHWRRVFILPWADVVGLNWTGGVSKESDRCHVRSALSEREFNFRRAEQEALLRVYGGGFRFFSGR